MTDKSVLAKEPLVFQPGFHSHNARRVAPPSGPPHKPYRRLQLALVLLGVCCLGFYLYSLVDQYVYQAYQNWAFDQQIAGNASVTFVDYLQAHAPLSSLFGPGAAEAPRENSPIPAASADHPQEGDVLGRVSVDRLQISAMVREGVSARTLSLAVGHVPSTALPGQLGNFAIAAHRDTLFRGLKDIRQGDLVTVQSTSATFQYRVVATKIVKPSDVSVLQSDGGGLISSEARASKGQPQRLLTMITCYPFRYIGSAPKRFIVEGTLLSGDSPDPLTEPSAVQGRQPSSGVSQRRSSPAKLTIAASGSSRHLRTQGRRRQGAPPREAQPVHKRKWWQKVFHRA